MTRDERLLVIRGFQHGQAHQVSPDGQLTRIPEDFWLEEGDPIFPHALAISPDGARLALSWAASSVEVHNLPDLEPVLSLDLDRVHALVFLDPDRLLVARYGEIVNYSDSASLEIWRCSTGERLPLRGRQGHCASVLSLAAPSLPRATDRGLLCSTGVDGTVRIWSAEALREIETLTLDSMRPAQVDADDNFGTLFVGWSSDLAYPPLAIDTRTFATQQKFESYVFGSRLSPDGRYVAHLSIQGQLRLVDARNGQALADFAPVEPRPYRLSWSPDARWLLAHGEALAIYDVERAVLVTQRPNDDQIYAAAMLSQGRYVWVDAAGLHLAHVDEESVLLTKAGTYFTYFHHHAVIAVSHDGATLAVTDGQRIWRFELATLARRGLVQWRRPPLFRLLSLCFSRDDSRLFAGTSMGPILAFDLVR
jgi:WD40 repeat protein